MASTTTQRPADQRYNRLLDIIFGTTPKAQGGDSE